MQEQTDREIKQVAKLAWRCAQGDDGPPSIIRLAGDASTRRYYRALFPAGAPLVVMVAPDRKSVEYFISMTTLMGKLGADTPALLENEDNMMAMEDLGDVMLQARVHSMPPMEIEAEYRAIITRLARFQASTCSPADREMECYSLRFDTAKLMYEVEFADQHFLKAYLGVSVEWSTAAIMRLEWEKIATELASQMETLAHRDFHSRNIMVAGPRRVWIDYQDARMGRMQYDLASLLLDPYVDLDQETHARLARYYFDLITAKGAAPWGWDRFNDLYDLSAVQRLYKALGTYGYQATVKNNGAYLPYIRPAVERLMLIMENSMRMKKLGRLLSPYLENAL